MDYETLNKNILELMEILRKADPRHPVLSGGKFAILTGEKPLHPVHPGWEGENETLVNNLNRLKAEGHIKHFEPVKGMYGAPENSFLVHSPNFEKIKELGHKLGQESVILSNNGEHHLAYTNGEHINKARPQEKVGRAENVPVVQHQTAPEDFYTETYDRPNAPKKLIFTLPIDFNDMVDTKGRQLGGSGKIQKSSPQQFEFNFDMGNFIKPHSDKNISVVKAFRRKHASNIGNGAIQQ